MEYGKCNNRKLATRVPGRCEYVYVDVPSHLADRFFVRGKVPVCFTREMRKDDSGYILVFCRFKKKYEEKFLRCMADLEKAMMIKDERNYQNFCEWFSGLFSS